MLQPFELFKEEYITRLLQLKKFYLVSQTYRRADNPFAEEQKLNILLTDYNDAGLARGHLSALRHDRFAAIIDLQKPAHKQTLLQMLQPSSAYCLFWAVVRSTKELEHRVDTKYKEHMRRYVNSHTTWRLDRNTTLYPSVQLIYGELFIILKYGSETLRITFEELEKS